MKTLEEMRDAIMAYVRVCWAGAGELDSPAAMIFGPGDGCAIIATDLHPLDLALHLSGKAQRDGADGVALAVEAWAATDEPALREHLLHGGEIRTFPGRHESLTVICEDREGRRKEWSGRITPAQGGSERTAALGEIEPSPMQRSYRSIRFFSETVRREARG